MWEIDETFEDYTQTKNIGYIKLNPNIEKTLNHQNITVKWNGILNGMKIEFTHKGDIYSDVESYDFPLELNSSKRLIMNFISEYYRYLD